MCIRDRQHTGNTGVQQRGKGVPTADVEKRTGDQDAAKRADDAGRQNIEGIPDHLPVRDDANFRYGGGAAGVDLSLIHI